MAPQFTLTILYTLISTCVCVCVFDCKCVYDEQKIYAMWPGLVWPGLPQSQTHSQPNGKKNLIGKLPPEHNRITVFCHNIFAIESTDNTHLSFNWSSVPDGNGWTTKCKDDMFFFPASNFHTAHTLLLVAHSLHPNGTKKKKTKTFVLCLSFLVPYFCC